MINDHYEKGKVMRSRLLILALLAVLVAVAAGCAESEPQVLRLATTTSTADSGLLDAILPDFEDEFNARVDVVAVGTGQAIELGEAGDADVILVHARAKEDAFVAEGHGTARYDVMYNDFIIVGPPADPAGIAGMATAAEALAAIAAAKPPSPRAATRAAPTPRRRPSGRRRAWPCRRAPTGTSRWAGHGRDAPLRRRVRRLHAHRPGHLPGAAGQPLRPGGAGGGASIAENPDTALLNPYGVIPVNPDKGGINADLAQDFVGWITSLETQEAIGAFGQEQFGQALFYPDSEAWRNR